MCACHIYTAFKRAWHLTVPSGCEPASQLSAPVQPLPTQLHSLAHPLPTLPSSLRQGHWDGQSQGSFPGITLADYHPFLQTLQTPASSALSPSLSPGATPTAGNRIALVSSRLGPRGAHPCGLGSLPSPHSLPARRPEQALDRAEATL